MVVGEEMARRSTFFDLVRLELAAAVIVSHSFGLYTGTEPGVLGASLGTWCVRGFFLLSGYLIAQSWRQDPHIGRFALRRFCRIVPAFAVAFVLSVGLGVTFGATPPITLWRDLLLLMPPDMLAFPGSHGAFVNGPMWTIHWEAICYALTPLLFPLLTHRRTAAVAWVSAGAAAFVFSSDRDVAAFLFCFLAGALASDHPMSIAVPGIKRLPDISYGVYLYGWPVQKALVALGVNSPWILFALTMPVVVALGFASHWLIERPAMRYALWRAGTPPLARGIPAAQ